MKIYNIKLFKNIIYNNQQYQVRHVHVYFNLSSKEYIIFSNKVDSLLSKVELKTKVVYIKNYFLVSLNTKVYYFLFKIMFLLLI